MYLYMNIYVYICISIYTHTLSMTVYVYMYSVYLLIQHRKKNEYLAPCFSIPNLNVKQYISQLHFRLS